MLSHALPKITVYPLRYLCPRMTLSLGSEYVFFFLLILAHFLAQYYYIITVLRLLLIFLKRTLVTDCMGFIYPTLTSTELQAHHGD